MSVEDSAVAGRAAGAESGDDPPTESSAETRSDQPDPAGDFVERSGLAAPIDIEERAELGLGVEVAGSQLDGADLEDLDSEPSPPRRDLTWLRRGLLAVWAIFIISDFLINGLAIDRNRLILYLGLGMAAATIGRRRAITVVIDWLPFALILMLYDWTRNIALWLDMPTHWHLAVDADHWIFGVNPTVFLQEHLKAAEAPFWEILISVVYMSYFIVPYATAAVLWLRDRADWRRFAACFIATSFLGLVGYTLVPAAPPWAAAKCSPEQVVDYPHDPACMYDAQARLDGGLLGPMNPADPDAEPRVERISARGWEYLNIDSAAGLIRFGQGKSNLVAAIPSLHAGLTMMLALFMWPRVKALGRTLFMGYAVAMAFTLVYTAEHYVFDILLGWGLAAVVVYAVTMVDRKIVRPRQARAAMNVP